VSDGLVGRYDYRPGVLQLGGATQDSHLLSEVLARVDGLLQAFLQAQGTWTPRQSVGDAAGDGANPPAAAAEPATSAASQ
jgi:hypothetical protein